MLLNTTVMTVLLYLVILIVQLHNSISSIPINIGVLINTFDKNNDQSIEGQQLLQSFLIGLEEATSLLPDYHFQFALSSAYGHFHAASETLKLVEEAFNTDGIHSCISALPNVEAGVIINITINNYYH